MCVGTGEFGGVRAAKHDLVLPVNGNTEKWRLAEMKCKATAESPFELLDVTDQ